MSALSISSIRRTHFPLASNALPEVALADVVRNVPDPCVSELRVAEPRNGVVFVKPLLGAGRGLDVPFEYGEPEGARDLSGKVRLAGARLALDKKRPFQRDGGIDGNLEIARRHVGVASLELHASLSAAGRRFRRSAPYGLFSHHRKAGAAAVPAAKASAVGAVCLPGVAFVQDSARCRFRHGTTGTRPGSAT